MSPRAWRDYLRAEREERRKRGRYGWRSWAVGVPRVLAGIVVVFALANLTLSLSIYRGENPWGRTVHELQTLWFSPLDGQPVDPDAFALIYPELGAAPTDAQIHDWFEREAEDDVFLLDQIMVDHIEARNGRIDGRTLPPGVYVGAHALGPDGLPFVPVTKYLAHYLLFARHAYILVVPEEGQAIAFSASQNAKFGIDVNPEQLSAEISAFDVGAYDFPSSGQAIHEMTRVTDDPARTAAAIGMLREAQARLAAENLTYGLLAPNSNTAIGCLLERAGAVTQEERSSILLALRAPGFGAACD